MDHLVLSFFSLLQPLSVPLSAMTVAPTLAMAAVIIGGAVNIFLDWLLVFPLEMGMRDAAIVTVTDSVLWWRSSDSASCICKLRCRKYSAYQEFLEDVDCCAILGVIFTAVGELILVLMVKLFVDATPEVITVTPNIVRLFFIIVISLGITVLSTYYLQFAMHDKMSMLIAILRSIVVSGILIYVLPMFLHIDSVWLAMPISKLIVVVIALCYIRKSRY